LLIYIYLYFAK